MKMEQPADCCTAMVVVPGTGKVRICTNLTELNKSVMREKQPLHSAEQTLGQIKLKAAAKMVSKLGTNVEF